MVLGIVSCSKPLPPIIQKQVEEVKTSVNQYDSVRLKTLKYTKSDIDKMCVLVLQENNLYSIKFDYDYYEKEYHTSLKKLDEILVLNPEYSSYDDIVNLPKPKELTKEQENLIYKNYEYSYSLYDYKLNEHFGLSNTSKPKY